MGGMEGRCLVNAGEAHAGRPYARVSRVHVHVHTFIGAWNSARLSSGRLRPAC